MEPKSAETWVKVFAILNWVSGAIGLLLGLLLLFSASSLGQLIGSYAVAEDPSLGDAATLQATFTFFFLGFGALLSILSLVSILIGFGVWWRKPWGRVLSIISLWIGAAWMLVTFFMALAGGEPYDILVQGLSFLIVVAISSFFLWLFHRDPTVRSMFGSRSPGVPRRPAGKALRKGRR